MKNILVTGGAGFIGSNLVQTLVSKNKNVIVVDNFSQGSYRNLASIRNKKNISIVKADILDTKKMIHLSKGVDTIYHLAVQCLRVSLADPLYVERINSGGTLSLLWAARKNSVSRFVYCSSSEVYGTAKSIPMNENHSLKPTTVYGASKLSGELYTSCFHENFGLKTVIVRPFNTYGYNEHVEGVYGEVIPRFVTLAKNNLSIVVFGDGKQTRDFTFVTDTVDGLIKAGQEENLTMDAINIAYGKEVSINDIARIVVKVTGSKSKIVYHPPRPYDVKRHFADITRAKKLLRFKPRIDIETGIKLYIAHLEKIKFDFKKALNDLPEKNW